MLTGRLNDADNWPKNALRADVPRLLGENFKANRALVARLEAFGAERGHTTAQLALAWLIARGEGIAPIPGTKRVSYPPGTIYFDDGVWGTRKREMPAIYEAPLRRIRRGAWVRQPRWRTRWCSWQVRRRASLPERTWWSMVGLRGGCSIERER